MPTGKDRTHNEWFQATKYGLCDCGANKRTRLRVGADPTVYSWGEYNVTRWNTVRRVCEMCFQREIIPRLIRHADPCGCRFALVPRHGHSLPPWITLVGTRLCTLPGPYVVRIGRKEDAEGYRYATLSGITDKVGEALTLPDSEVAWKLAAFYTFGAAIPQSEAA